MGEGPRNPLPEAFNWVDSPATSGGSPLVDPDMLVEEPHVVATRTCPSKDLIWLSTLLAL